MPNLVIKNEIPLKFLHFFSLPLKKKFVLYIFVEKRKKKKGWEGTELSQFDKKILPSITDSSIEIGVIYLRIETGHNALLALIFFIYDGLPLVFLHCYVYSPRILFTIATTSEISISPLSFMSPYLSTVSDALFPRI